MQILSPRQNKAISHHRVISTVFLILLFIAPLSAFAQDTTGIDTLRQTSKAFTEIAGKTKPAVVGIKAEKTVTWDYPSLDNWPFSEPFDPFGDDFFDRFFRRRRSPQREYQQTAQGSGFIISPDGYILTSNHLIQNAEKVTVKLGENSPVEAKVIGTDPDTDVAVVKIDGNDLPYLELADSDALEVGEWVLAIGNPFGLSHTVTAGIISAKSRSGFRLTEYEDYIQTDAAINPGNSGGPLLDLDGKVVGINTFIISRSGGFMGIGFAIPINMAKFSYDQLIKGKPVERGGLGIVFIDLDPDTADSLGLEETKGAVIADVVEDSAAEKAGMKRYDVVVEFNGKKVENANELKNQVAMLKPGTKVKIVVLRNGKRKTLTAELGEQTAELQSLKASTEVLERLGFAVRNLTDDLAERYGYEGYSGVIIAQVEADSEAARKGIVPGMLIEEVNRTPVKNTNDFREAIEKAAEKGKVLLLINDGRYNRLVILTLSKK